MVDKITITFLLEQYSAYILGLLVSGFLGIFFVKAILYPFPSQEGEGGLKHAGMVIGFFERIIVTILVFMGEYNAIAFVLTAKSIARFERLKEREFAEYYLIGTLSSIGFAIVVGLFAIYIL